MCQARVSMCVTAKAKKQSSRCPGKASKLQGGHAGQLCLLGLEMHKESADALRWRRRLGCLLAAAAPAAALALGAATCCYCCRWRPGPRLELLSAVPHRLRRRGGAGTHNSALLLRLLLRLACRRLLLVGDWLHGLPLRPLLLLLLPAGKRRGGFFPAANRLTCCRRLGPNTSQHRGIAAAVLLLLLLLLLLPHGLAACRVLPGCCCRRSAVWQRRTARLP